MTREDAAKLWPIIKAWSEGKTIQQRGSYAKWHDVRGPNFRAPADHYRIKPEPVECWAVIAEGATRPLTVHSTRHEAVLGTNPSYPRVIKLREVQE